MHTKFARKLKIKIKLIGRLFLNEEKFNLTSQINKSSAGILANIAIGLGKTTNFNEERFTNISYSFVLKTVDHLNILRDLKYIPEKKYTELSIKLNVILNKLNALHIFQINNKEILKKIFNKFYNKKFT